MRRFLVETKEGLIPNRMGRFKLLNVGEVYATYKHHTKNRPNQTYKISDLVMNLEEVGKALND